jgi:putative hydrolase of the HAD superfamily
VIRAVMFDFGGVVSTSPFEAFARFEVESGLPVDFVRQVNSTNPDTNAWSMLERGEVDLDQFCTRFEAEALALGHALDARALMGGLDGGLRPEMVAAVRFCSNRFKTACLTNNFSLGRTERRPEMAEVFELFDVVLESSKLGVRKPDPRFYEMACESVDVEPSEVVYLDDLGVNLKPARQMGMRTIKVVRPEPALVELASVIGVSVDELVASRHR